MWERMCRPDIVTPAGIRQAFPNPHKYIRNRQHMPSGQGPRYGGLKYLVIDKGPQQQWAELWWVEGINGRRRVRVVELEEDKVEEWTDGSRMEGRAAAATRMSVQYLGAMATIADLEALGVSLAWERCDVVALDSKGVIQKIQGLEHQAPRSWIEERLASQMVERPRTLMWVKGHDGVEGNERRTPERGKR